MKKIFIFYLESWWVPALVYLITLMALALCDLSRVFYLSQVAELLFYFGAVAFLGMITASIWNLVKQRWVIGGVNVLGVFGCAMLTLGVFFIMVMASIFGPSEDGFADHLRIPEGIEIAEPEESNAFTYEFTTSDGSDPLHEKISQALAVPGNNNSAFAPSLPSLRKASMDHLQLFYQYLEASPDWHVFKERGNRFAVRRWSFSGRPHHTLHGYVSKSARENRLQTRCLLCLDQKEWSRYEVQTVPEGAGLIQPKMETGNGQPESRVMIQCGGVWVEIFEQSSNQERRITKATIAVLEEEFSSFVKDPQAALDAAKLRSVELAKLYAGTGGHDIGLMNGMQPGIYQAMLSLNPGEPGYVYLKAFEVTRGTALSRKRLKENSTTRMAWSSDPNETFSSLVGFTIYEGDWGKPYAARFEVWFIPDSGKAERKLTERNFKIEGWMR